MPEYADSSRTRDETPHERHERWAWIHETAAMTGWDFSPLAGRLVADDPPWDFDRRRGPPASMTLPHSAATG